MQSVVNIITKNNNGSAKFTCVEKVKNAVEIKPAALPEVHPMVIVTVLPFPSN